MRLLPLFSKPRNDENSRIPQALCHPDLRVSVSSPDLSFLSSPDLTLGSHYREFRIPCVIARKQSDRSNLIKSLSLRGVSETNDEAISFKA